MVFRMVLAHPVPRGVFLMRFFVHRWGYFMPYRLTGGIVLKKTLIALAVLGSVAGVAQAQSSVQLYGIVDAYFGSVKNGVGASSNTVMNSGGLSASRWGLRGSEDLGGGLKANFKLEQAFNADTGTASVANGFSRAAWVGLSGAFGEVQYGQNATPFEDINGAAFPSFDSVLSAEYYVFRSVGYTAFASNTLKYISPSFGGFSLAASYSLDESQAIKADTRSINLTYANGPLYVGFAYQDDGQIGPNPKYTRLAGSYDFGAVKLLANYGYTKLFGTPNTRDLSIGVDVPLSSTLTLSTGYAQSKDKNAAKRDGFSVSALYALSKRTTVYGGVMSAKEKLGNVRTDENRVYAVGMRHAF